MTPTSRGRRLLSDAMTLIMVLAAVGVAAGAVRNSFFRTGDASTNGTVATIPLPQWNHMLAKAHIASGDGRSQSTVLVFTDYQCPFCSRLEHVLDTMHTQSEGAVRVAYRHYPLPQHPFARLAARAAVCAEPQGGFPALHRLMFAQQDSLGVVPWTALATTAGVRADSLAPCMAHPETDAVVAADVEAGQRLRLAGTPTIYIDGRLFTGRMTIAGLDSAVRYAITHPRVASR